MNARIKQLATEARLLTGWPVGEVEYQKFAELIVKECANFAYDYTSNEENVADFHDVGWDCLPGQLRSELKKHLGVEE
jgi:hypothetical protein